MVEKIYIYIYHVNISIIQTIHNVEQFSVNMHVYHLYACIFVIRYLYHPDGFMRPECTKSWNLYRQTPPLICVLRSRLSQEPHELSDFTNLVIIFSPHLGLEFTKCMNITVALIVNIYGDVYTVQIT